MTILHQLVQAYILPLKPRYVRLMAFPANNL
jgi:hypothetical protein